MIRKRVAKVLAVIRYQCWNIVEENAGCGKKSVSSVNATLVVAKILGETIRRAQRDRNHADEHVHDEYDLCRPLLPVAYSPSGHHCSGSKSGFIKCAVLKCELEGVSNVQERDMEAAYLRKMEVWNGCTCMEEPKPGSSSYMDGLKGPPLSTPMGAALSMLTGGGGGCMGSVTGGCSRWML